MPVRPAAPAPSSLARSLANFWSLVRGVVEAPVAVMSLASPRSHRVAHALIATVCVVSAVLLPAPAAPVAAAPQPVPSPAHLELIQQAAGLLTTNFYQPVDSAKLLDAAVSGANDELKRQGVGVSLQRVSFTHDPAGDWTQFQGAYSGAATGYSSLIDHTALAQATISAMADGLKDCHTYFMPAAQAQRMQQGLKGQNTAQGIGIAVRGSPDGKQVAIEEVHKGSPAATAGLKPGDLLQTIDGVDITSLTRADFAGKLREPQGSPVTLTFSRAGFPGVLQASPVRGTYSIPVYDTALLRGNVGLIRLSVFAERLDSATFQQIYTDLTAQGATSFLVDLRNNPGGSGEGAMALLSALIPGQQPLFAHQKRDGSSQPMTTSGRTWPTTPKVAVLINGRTASAGEIVAAVAQDYGVARVFGQQSKGCIASVDFSPLKDGSMLGVTNALVVTSKGRSLNGIGVTPDVVVESPFDALTRGEDPQRDRALSYLTGK